MDWTTKNHFYASNEIHVPVGLSFTPKQDPSCTGLKAVNKPMASLSRWGKSSKVVSYKFEGGARHAVALYTTQETF